MGGSDLKNISLGTMLGLQDIKQAYRRSAIGSFWITIGMAFQILIIGFVFGVIFRMPINEYLPFLASGLILWSFFSTTISEGCLSFISSETLIRQLNLPLFVYVVRTVWKNIIMFGHNAVILPLVFLIVGQFSLFEFLFFVPGVVLLVANVSWVSFILAFLSARFRDIPQVVSSALVALFYLTPVMWSEKLLGNNVLAHWLLGLNPIYHWLQIVKLPLLGELPTFENWAISAVSVLIGWVGAYMLHKKAARHVPYWL